MLEDSENIAGFFKDQPGGELCLALFIDICQTLIKKDEIDALEYVIETLYTICEISRRWSDATEEWVHIFFEVTEMQIYNKDDV